MAACGMAKRLVDVPRGINRCVYGKAAGGDTVIGHGGPGRSEPNRSAARFEMRYGRTGSRRDAPLSFQAPAARRGDRDPPAFQHGPSEGRILDPGLWQATTRKPMLWFSSRGSLSLRCAPRPSRAVLFQWLPRNAAPAESPTSQSRGSFSSGGSSCCRRPKFDAPVRALPIQI